MANYTTTVRSPWTPEEAFRFVADFRNFEKWDPGVSSSTIKSGAEPGVGTVYEVVVKGATLDYVTQAHAEPTRAVVEGASNLFYSYDVIEIEAVETGCEVTYDATLKLRSLAAVFNPVLGFFFDRLGDPAARGLAEALDGTIVT